MTIYGSDLMKSIYYSGVTCFLGRMLVAASEDGICFLGFGDEDAEVLAAITQEFPGVPLRYDPARLKDLGAVLQAHLESGVPLPDLPLDLRGTPFQQRVWAELRRIPYGETRSYTQMAQALGMPNAVRAAAHANACNPVSLIVPCHRVLRQDGSLGGYRWGLDRKKKLLERERKLMSG
jgi:AraC family transcriptional regulator, regulatory protein of adaptative response / methylated-DNA-[protein]-cysteine methyltransferase